MTTFRIGCSGYYYPGWKDKFYPKGLSSKEWLTYYSSIFNTVEINSTFYRTPTLAILKKYANATPDDFTFSVKVGRQITHLQKLNESHQLIEDFQGLVQEGLGQKLAFFLFQMPPAFHYSEENLGRVLENIPNEERNVLEFRHPSWWNDRVREAMENVRLTFCNVDFPGMKTSFIHTTQSFYLRTHGNPELFKSAYELKELLDFIDQFPIHAKTVTVYFNNTYYEAGYTNASQMMEIVEHQDALN